VAARAGVVASALDRDQVPSFFWAADRRVPAATGGEETPELTARAHLRRLAPAQRASGAAVDAARMVRLDDLGEGGLIAHFRQRVDDLEVYPGDVKVLMRRGGELVAVSGRLRVAAPSSRAGFLLPEEEAVAIALGHLFDRPIVRGDVRESAGTAGAFRRFQLLNQQDVTLTDGAHVKRLYFAEGDRLVPAYFIEMYAGLAGAVESEAFRYIVAADDGRILQRRSLTHSDVFTYRVWADTTGDFRPLDGPISNFTPHPTGNPDSSLPTLIPPVLVNMEGFNTNPFGQPDPWLPAGAVQTVGNNVDAYSDHSAPDGYSNGDLRATTTATRTFDRTYDTAAGPLASPNQTMAAVTHAFYTANWLHDWYYDSGFNEAAGNAQTNNFGRGGLGGDAMRVEAQDNYLGGSRNNANMSTPSDGLAPRMQMYVWSGETTQTLTATPGGTIPSGSASFGPTSYDLTANLVLAADGTAPPTDADACQPLTNNVAGMIVLVDRGNCTFVVKAQNVQAAGGAGMLVANNVAGTIPPGLGGADPTITIPSLGITQADGNTLKAALASGTVSIRMFRQTGVERDGDLDSTIVAHEWGHYLHHRLADCGVQQCRAQSEGWGDFLALHMAARDGDDLDGTYALAIYSTRARTDSGYFGIRRYPYSVNMTRNGLMLRHISDGEALPMTPGVPSGANSQVHNAGEVWASMLWEVYVALQKARGTRTFDDVRRRMSDYIVAGLKLAPQDATYTEQRDAILAAIAARDAADLAVAAQAFATRGAGTCAVAPPRDSTNLTGVVESTAVKPRLEIGEIRLDDAVRSCDDDGFLDGDERGNLKLTILNAGPVAAAGTTVTVTSSTAGLTFPAGASATIPTIAPFSSAQVTLEVALDPSVTQIEQVNLDVQVNNADACAAMVTGSASFTGNLDDVPAASATDTVESPVLSWARTGTDAHQVWSRIEVVPGSHALLGADLARQSDTQLESPDLVVGSGAPLQVSFTHRYSFETDTTPTYWDGAVIEISDNGGQTWTDVRTIDDPGYNGTLTTTSGNPLGGRLAFVATNPAYPARDQVSLDLGTSFAGKTVRLRFRIGTDANTGGPGWEIDDVAVTGITNTPFRTVVADASVCSLRCDAGLTACGDVCTLLRTDPANCGACGNACAAGSVCSSGQCVVSCQAGLANCGGACVNQATDNAHCGACGNTCALGSTCRAGKCEAPPVARGGGGKTVTSGTEVSLNASASSDANGDTLTYAWSQLAGPAVTLSGGSAAVATFVAPEVQAPTLLTFRVSVSDGSSTSTDDVDITVTPRTGCGCGASDGPAAAGWAVLLLGLALFTRRRAAAPAGTRSRPRRQ
jgi:MYXO-CTERM domain-containing protein